MPDTRKHRFIIITLILIAVIALIWWIHQRQSSAQEAAAQKRGGMQMAVSVAKVKKQDVPMQITALGTVTSSYTVTVRSRVDGQLEKLHFNEGDMVKQGQLLAELDARPFQAALTQAQGQLMRDQALLKNAQLDLKRYQQLLEQNSIAEQQVETQQALVHQYEGTVKVDEGQVENARLQFDYTRITAPASGRVGLRQVDPGNIVHSSDTTGVVVITQLQPINVVFSVPETSLTQVLDAIKQNPTLIVQAWSRDNHSMLTDGTLLAIDNQLNASTGTVNLKARFNNDKQQLFPNQFINVRLQLGARTDVLAVPTPAIQIGKPGNFVYVLNDDQTVSVAKVRIGVAAGDVTVIEEGLHEGQTVVVDGLDKLRDGAKVKVATPPSPENTGDEKASEHRREHSGEHTSDGAKKEGGRKKDWQKQQGQ